MKGIFTFLALLILVSVTKADVYTFESSGNWNEASNWDTYPGTSVDVGDEVIVSADISINASITINGLLMISENVELTNDWLLTINGSMTNDGHVLNNTQLNLFGDCVSNGTWENSEDGTLIVTGTGDFSGYGTFVNNGGLLGYNSSKFYLEASFENYDYVTFNGDFDINHSGGSEFINSGFVQFNGQVRLEGRLVNSAGKNFNVNWSSNMIVSDNSKIENNGSFNIDGSLEMSSLLNAHSTLGNVVVDGIFTIKPSIVEVL